MPTTFRIKERSARAIPVVRDTIVTWIRGGFLVEQRRLICLYTTV